MENTVSQRRNHNIAKKSSKPTRRRFHTRRVLQDCVINMAEARRAIVEALQLHRSSLSSITRTTTVGRARTTSARVSVFGNSSRCCYYSLTESMPVPEPIWSTTTPAIPAVAVPAPQAGATESLEFEWGESQAADYSWWLAFLETLDCKNMNTNVENSKYQQHLEFLQGAWVSGSKLVEEQNSYPTNGR